ncbi:MAG: DUF488 family protein [Patescibacteria group bacterium]|nr:DUF488 family protein [Patescibacteria group bacterium]
MITLKRIYEKPEKEDGTRILVDRLWPRGISKEEAKIDLWLKDIGPSNNLRKWFNHEDFKWEEFKQKYFEELKDKKELVEQIKKQGKTVTFLFGAKNIKHNNAVALKEYFEM